MGGLRSSLKESTMKKKQLPPLADNPIFRSIVNDLTNMDNDTIEAFQEFREEEVDREDANKVTKLSTAHKGPKSE